MVDLFNTETNQLLGTVSDDDLQAMADVLEEESEDDRDYFINPDTIDLLEGKGSPKLIEVLRAAVGSGEGVEIRWERR